MRVRARSTLRGMFVYIARFDGLLLGCRFYIVAVEDVGGIACPVQALSTTPPRTP